MSTKRSPKPLKQQPAFKRLQKLAQQPGKRDLLWYHRAGREIELLFPSDDRAYGSNVMETLADALGQSVSPVNLWNARRFSRECDRDRVKRLCQPVKGQYRLTWSHLIHLLSLADADRLPFEEDCIGAEWSCKELHRQIQDYQGQQGKGGRQFQKPATLKDALRQMINVSIDWQRRFHSVWFHPDNPAIDWDDKSASTDEVAELCREAVDVMETIQFGIKQRLPELRSYARVKKKVRRRRKLT